MSTVHVVAASQVNARFVYAPLKVRDEQVPDLMHDVPVTPQMLAGTFSDLDRLLALAEAVAEAIAPTSEHERGAAGYPLLGMLTPSVSAALAAEAARTGLPLEALLASGGSGAGLIAGMFAADAARLRLRARGSHGAFTVARVSLNTPLEVILTAVLATPLSLKALVELIAEAYNVPARIHRDRAQLERDTLAAQLEAVQIQSELTKLATAALFDRGTSPALPPTTVELWQGDAAGPPAEEVDPASA